MKKPELLAPAGGWEAFVAAVENGADAVYLGGRLFNARQSAANFDEDDLSRAVEYAHLRGVKIYVTVNTLIADNEMEDALKFLFRLQKIGADAAILQDMGLASLARRAVPDLPLHASTQMTAHNSPGVTELLRAGFERVVLAREMSLDEIQKIKNTTGADLEVFIHGAICISYSGQCLLSSMIGGRSGNRGRCAQPCRMQYNLVDRAGKNVDVPDHAGEYLLSPRDLNISGYIPGLISAGIDSFKIEGRMKRPEYVATVVRIYRGLIDRALSGEAYSVSSKEKESLTQIFNRDFTSGYFFGSQGRDLMSYKRPNNRGLRLGRVKGFDRGTGLVEIALERPLRAGDGLEVWVTEGGRVGFTVDVIHVHGQKVDKAAQGETVGLNIPGRVKPGDRVFKTHDADLVELARESFASPKGARRKIPLAFEVEGGVGFPLTITAIDPDGRSVTATTDSLGAEAEKRPLDQDYLKEMLGKLGNTPFSMASTATDIKGRVIYPASEINQARRKAVTGLEKRILADRHIPPAGREEFLEKLDRALKNRSRKIYSRREMSLLAVSVGDLESLKSAVAAGADIIYFGLDVFRSKPSINSAVLLKAADYCREKGSSLVLSTPRIIKDREIDSILDAYEGVTAGGILAGNLGLIPVLTERFPALPVVADFGLNAFNRHTLDYLIREGISRVTLSPELTMSQVKSLAGDYPVEVFVQGAVELMVSEHCLPGAVLGDKGAESVCTGVCAEGEFGLKDRTGAVFPVETDRFCRMHLFNSRDLCLIEDIRELSAMGVSCIRIEARRERPYYVSEVTKIYRKALDGLLAPVRKHHEPVEAREMLETFSPAGITKGHYYRGV
ncbi:MAG: DUF3656 domain-containing U32 family peptidase [Bacillota bacterium]